MLTIEQVRTTLDNLESRIKSGSISYQDARLMLAGMRSWLNKLDMELAGILSRVHELEVSIGGE